MDFSLNDEQKMMIETVRRFITEELKPLEDEVENKGFLDPFSPQTDAQRAYALGMLNQIHQQFIGAVKAGRGERRVLLDAQERRQPGRGLGAGAIIVEARRHTIGGQIQRLPADGERVAGHGATPLGGVGLGDSVVTSSR